MQFSLGRIVCSSGSARLEVLTKFILLAPRTLPNMTFSLTLTAYGVSFPTRVMQNKVDRESWPDRAPTGELAREYVIEPSLTFLIS